MAVSRCLRLLTFDVTNTIIRVKGTPAMWYAQAAQNLGLHTETRRLDAVYGTVWRKMRTEFPHYGYNQGMTSKEWWGEFLCRLFPAAGYVADPQLYVDIGEHLHRTFTGGECYDTIPGSHDVLEELKRSGLALGIVSNFDERLVGVLEGHGLLDYFDFIETSVTSRCDKPAPKIFYNALKQAKVAPQEAGHVGDDVKNDYWGARRVGLKPFLFDPKQKLTDADLEGVDRHCVIHNLTDLIELTRVVQKGWAA